MGYSGLCKETLNHLLSYYEQKIAEEQVYFDNCKRIKEAWDGIDIDKINDDNMKVSLFVIKEYNIGVYDTSLFLLNSYREQFNNIKNELGIK